MTLEKAGIIAVAIVLTLCASTVVADSAHINAFVTQTRVAGDDAYGGCMAALSKSPKNMLPACKNTWVTFSCDGTYTDPVRAYRMLDQAQLSRGFTKIRAQHEIDRTWMAQLAVHVQELLDEQPRLSSFGLSTTACRRPSSATIL